MSHAIEVALTQEAMCQKSFIIESNIQKGFYQRSICFCCSPPFGHDAMLVQAVTFIEPLSFSSLPPLDQYYSVSPAFVSHIEQKLYPLSSDSTRNKNLNNQFISAYFREKIRVNSILSLFYVANLEILEQCSDCNLTVIETAVRRISRNRERTVLAIFTDSFF